MNVGNIKLSKAEKAKWPFLQPGFDGLRADMREAKGTLMWMLHVTSLALSKRMADLNQSASTSVLEKRDVMRAIVALQQQQRRDEGKPTRHTPRLRKGRDSPNSEIGLRLRISICYLRRKRRLSYSKSLKLQPCPRVSRLK